MLDFQFTPKQFNGLISINSEQFVHAQEHGLILYDHTGIGRNRHLAVGKGIKRIFGNLRRLSRGQ